MSKAPQVRKKNPPPVELSLGVVKGYKKLAHRMRMIAVIGFVLALTVPSSASMPDCDAGGKDVLSLNSFSRVEGGPLPYLLPKVPFARDVLQIVSSKYESGERWEMSFEEKVMSVFRYWNWGLGLDSETAQQDLRMGWTNATEQYQRFSDFSSCSKIKHYSMITPSESISQTLLNTLPGDLQHGDFDFAVFASCAQTAAALHFDRNDNYFLQLKGTKRFYLFHPKNFAHLYYAPRGHPLYRQSLLSPLNLTNVDMDAFPHLSSASSKHNMVVDLEEGDVLYLPRLWGHFVLSVTDTIGLSIHRHLEEDEKIRLQSLPLPFESDWAVEVKFASVRFYLDQILPERLKSVLKATWKMGFAKPKRAAQRDVSFSLVEDAAKIASYAAKLTFASEMSLLEYCEDVVQTMFTAKQAVDFMLDVF